jgi:WD40 repeat protein
MNLINIIISMAILLLIFSNSACVYIPSTKPQEEQFTDQNQARIIVGSTSKAEVIDLLGKPDLVENPRFFVYGKSHEHGTFLIILAAPGGQGFLAPVPVNTKHFVVLLEFDDHDIVTRYEIESSTVSVGRRPTNGDSIPLSAKSERKAVINADSTLLGIPRSCFFKSVNFSPDGEQIGASCFTVGPSDKIWIKNLKTDTLKIIDTEDFYILIISPDFSRAALINKKVSILDLNTEKVLTVFNGHGDSSGGDEGAACLAFDPKSSLIATGGYDGRVIVWDSDSGQEVWSFQGNDGTVLSVAYSWDGRWLATLGEDNETKVWNAATFEEVGAFKTNIGLLTFSPDNQNLVINSLSHVERWHLNTTSEDQLDAPALALEDVYLLPDYSVFDKLSGPPISSATFSQDGKFMAASNGAIVIYDIPNKQTILRVIPGETNFFNPLKDVTLALDLCPDGTCFATGTGEGVVFLWQLIPQIDKTR